jgi:hypothetical protein
MAKPIIGYKNLLRNGTITDPGTATGFLIANLQDYKSFTLWKSSVVTSPINIDIDMGVGNSEDADYIALVNHNLNTLGATVTVLADTVTPPVAVAQAAFSPGEDTVTFKAFTAPGAKRYWRIVLTDPAPPFASAPFIAQLMVGLKTNLPQFLTPEFDPYFRQVEVEGSRSKGGHALGVLLRGQTHRGEISMGPAGTSKTDWDSDLTPFLDNHALKRLPFVYVVDNDDSTFDVATYIKMTDDDDVRRFPVGNTWLNLGFGLPVEEAFQEPA